MIRILLIIVGGLFAVPVMMALALIVVGGVGGFFYGIFRLVGLLIGILK